MFFHYVHIGDYTDQCQSEFVTTRKLFSIKNQKMGITLFSNGDTFLVISQKHLPYYSPLHSYRLAPHYWLITYTLIINYNLIIHLVVVSFQAETFKGLRV